MSKPREFWLGLNEKVIYTQDDFIRGEPKEDFPFIRVIDYAAYDDALKMLEEMAKALDRANYQGDYYDQKPHKAMEVVYSNREALDKYRAWKEQK